MRIMGLDVGDRRIGVAVSDPLLLTAQGVAVVERKGIEKDFEALRELCQKYEVERLVVGLPLNMNGTLGPKAHQIQEFAHLLAGNLELTLEFYDERLTTKQAQDMLIAADVSRRKRRQVVDKIAAVHILQAYLDRRQQKRFN